MGIMNQPVACKERGFSSMSSQMQDVLCGLEEAVSGFDNAFAPVLTPEPPQVLCENSKVSESSSEYIMTMRGFISRIQGATAHILNICRRSEI